MPSVQEEMQRILPASCLHHCPPGSHGHPFPVNYMGLHLLLLPFIWHPKACAWLERRAPRSSADGTASSSRRCLELVSSTLFPVVAGWLGKEALATREGFSTGTKQSKQPPQSCREAKHMLVAGASTIAALCSYWSGKLSAHGWMTPLPGILPGLDLHTANGGCSHVWGSCTFPSQVPLNVPFPISLLPQNSGSSESEKGEKKR